MIKEQNQNKQKETPERTQKSRLIFRTIYTARFPIIASLPNLLKHKN